VKGWSSGVFLSVVLQTYDPLIPTGERVSTESTLARVVAAHPEKSATVLGGVVADVVSSLPSFDQVRNMSVRLGPLSIIDSPEEEIPPEGGVAAGEWGYPAGFITDYSDDGQTALRTFPNGIPVVAQQVLSLAGCGSINRADGRSRKVTVDESVASEAVSSAFARIGIVDRHGHISESWVAAPAALIVLHHQFEESARASTVEARREIAGVRTAGTALMALRWALWRRRMYLGPRWTSDSWGERSVKRWTAAMDIRGLSGLPVEHWGISDLEEASVGDLWES